MSSSHKKLFLKASALISVAIILSRILGMVREQYSLYLFGAGWELDAYVSASKIPNVFRNLLGEGAFSAVFISIFAGLLTENKEKARAFANRVISYLLVFSITLSALGIIGAPFYLKLIHRSSVNFDMVVHLTAYIMPFLTFISLSAIFMGILNSSHIYFIPALAPFFGNISFLALVFFLHKSHGVNSLALAFLGSSITYVLIQIPVLIKHKFQFRFNFTIDENLKYFFKCFLPVAFGMAVFQMNRIISNVFSSSIQGGNTIFEKAFILAQLILSVFITGISTAVLPLLARSEEDTDKNLVYTDSLRFIFLVMLPAGIFFLLLGQEISSFVYKDILIFLGLGTGKISDSAIRQIGKMLFYFGPGIIFFGLITIINRGFQGLKLFYYPVIGSALSVVLNFALMARLVPSIGLAGLPISISIAALVNMTTLLILFQRKTKVEYKAFFTTAARSISAGGLLFTTIWYLKKITLPLIYKTPFLLILGSIVYGIALFILGEKEIRSLFLLVWRKIKHKKAIEKPKQSE